MVTKATQGKGAAGTVTSASAWKKQTVGGTLITVPSGNTALVRAPGMQAFLQQGVIPNTLIPVIMEAMAKGAAPAEDDVKTMLDDPKQLTQILELADAVTVYCCVDPKVTAAPTDEQGNILPMDSPDRDADVLYVDEVDLNDKMFIFNFAVGGSADLEKFRTE